MYRTLPDYICKDTTSGRGDLHTLVQDGSLSSFLVHFGSRWYSSACVILAAGRSQEWWLSASYMDTRLRHIWYLLASYMILACVIYDALSCHVECRLRPNMPPASTLYADIWNHLSWCCYTLGEWGIFMLPSRRETATISANGGGWSYTLSERLNVKCLIIRWIDLKNGPYTIPYIVIYILYYTFYTIRKRVWEFFFRKRMTKKAKNSRFELLFWVSSDCGSRWLFVAFVRKCENGGFEK